MLEQPAEAIVAGDVEVDSRIQHSRYDGFPAGRVGLYTDVQDTEFDDFRIMDDAAPAQLAQRWIQPTDADHIGIDAATDRLRIAPQTIFDHHTPVLLRHRYASRFEAVFALEADDSAELRFVFGAEDQDHFNDVLISHIDIGGGDFDVSVGPGRRIVDGEAAVAVTGTGDPSVTAQAADTVWVRVYSDATNVTVEVIVGGASAPGNWSSPDTSWTSDQFDHTAGMIGFSHVSPGLAATFIDDLTVSTDTDDNGSYETTDLVETFELDGNGFAVDEPAHDAAGNLVYDGLHAYSYDAWNRLVAVHRAYHDGNDVQLGSQIQANRYDGLDRRIARATTNTPRDIHKRYVYAGQSVVHVRHASDYPVRQMVWAGTFGAGGGGGYVDELIQVGMGNPPTAVGVLGIHEFFWPIHNANYNVMAMIDEDGLIAERYEYTPYGERQIYISAGPHDLWAMNPVGESPRWEWDDHYALVWNYGLNPVGHQGLMHDGAGSATGGGTSLVYNRARYLHVRFGRFTSADPLGYIDSMNRYEYLKSRVTVHGDPSGLYRQPRLTGASPSRMDSVQKDGYFYDGWFDFVARRRYAVLVEWEATNESLFIKAASTVLPYNAMVLAYATVKCVCEDDEVGLYKAELEWASPGGVDVDTSEPTFVEKHVGNLIEVDYLAYADVAMSSAGVGEVVIASGYVMALAAADASYQLIIPGRGRMPRVPRRPGHPRRPGPGGTGVDHKIDLMDSAEDASVHRSLQFIWSCFEE